jgi:hypothetical protein
MERRSFMQATFATALAAGAASADQKARDVYELRVCSLKPGKLPLLDQYLL